MAVLGSTRVPRVRLGVTPNRSANGINSCGRKNSLGQSVFGGTPKTARETRALPGNSGRDVAQVSKPAVSPISKSAGRWKFERASNVAADADWEICDTADSEVCATTERGSAGHSAGAVFGALRIVDALFMPRATHLTTFAKQESQRDSVLQPRVATQELPWEDDVKAFSTPTGLW
jgi:hypothetical protein